ncbi:diguanylate cyclase DgcR [Leptospira idonii]|uniref:diguanylate cyclase n=1 Tax=Leptospira idonii TaxID=1193500 RepID=A0A4R9M6D8_9LEPT|nr:diguanylate cyclase [Leptospira idonii]TGN20248.1 diguanylate cyclase [Leptospira idonii]
MSNKILIVEDSLLQRQILIKWLTKHSYTCIIANDAQEAREIIAKESIEVVLLDWELPDGSGIDLIKEILSSSPTGWLPIIMVTSHSEPEKIKEAIEAGATDFIRKPAEEIELLARIYSALRIKFLQDQLRDTAIRDPLTGLYNRRYMEERVDQEFQRCKRHSHPLSIAMIDIDFFKSVNDTYGHDVGDVVLKLLANELKTRLRKSDILSRFGGEEFVIVFPETANIDAKHVLDKIREAITQIPIHSDDQKEFHISFSGGVTGGDLEHVAHPSELLKIADKNLYEAKHQGRNRVILS